MINLQEGKIQGIEVQLKTMYHKPLKATKILRGLVLGVGGIYVYFLTVDGFWYQISTSDIVRTTSSVKNIDPQVREILLAQYKAKAVSKEACKQLYLMSKPLSSQDFLYEICSHLSKDLYLYLAHIENVKLDFSIGTTQNLNLEGVRAVSLTVKTKVPNTIDLASDELDEFEELAEEILDDVVEEYGIEMPLKEGVTDSYAIAVDDPILDYIDSGSLMLEQTYWVDLGDAPQYYSSPTVKLVEKYAKALNNSFHEYLAEKGELIVGNLIISSK